MYYHPFSSSNQWNYHYPHSKPKSTAMPYMPHPDLYPNASVSQELVYMPDPRVFSFHNNPIIYYTPYPNVHYRYQPLPPPPPPTKVKRIGVLLEGIYCKTAGSGEFGNLDIYGTLQVNNEIMWKADKDNAVKIHEGSLLPITKEKIFDVKKDESLKLHGHLWEHDSWPDDDDDMSYQELKIPYDDIISTYRKVLRFTFKDQIVEAWFRVTRHATCDSVAGKIVNCKE